MTPLPTSAPHARAAELHCWVLGSFGELRLLRAALREAVAESPPSPPMPPLPPMPPSPSLSGPGGGHDSPADLDEVVDRMTVVATELATNALRHGLPPTEVRLLRAGRLLIIDVADHDPQALPRVDEDRPLGAGGLGLQLTRTFATEVGWYTGDHTKHVWASFPS